MTEIFILVPGEPVAKGRPRFAKRGAFVTTYTPEKTREYAWMDDSQVVEASVTKQYSEDPCAIIKVRELDLGLPLNA